MKFWSPLLVECSAMMIPAGCRSLLAQQLTPSWHNMKSDCELIYGTSYYLCVIMIFIDDEL